MTIDKKTAPKVSLESSESNPNDNTDSRWELLGSKLASFADVPALREKLLAIGKVAELYDASSYVGFRKFLSDNQDRTKAIFNTTENIESNDFMEFKTEIEQKELEATIRNVIRNTLVEIQEEKLGSHKKPWQKRLDLTDEGNLCLGSNKYEFRTEGKRIRIIYNLLEAKDYIKTKTLREKTGYKTNESLRDAIKEINGKAKYRLKIKDNLIEGRAESGYRINQNYIIV